VLLATRIYEPEAAAASFRLRALVRGLSERGAAVEVLTARPPRGLLPADDGGRVRRWPVLRDRAGYVRGYLPYLSFDLPLALRLLAARRPDVVVVEPPPTTGAVVRSVTMLRSALGRHLPYVYYAADVWSDAAASTGAPAAVVGVLRALERYALRGARDVIAVSEGVAERVRELAEGHSVTVVPNGVDTDTFSLEDPGNLVEDSSLVPDPTDGPFLLYAGTASEWQGAEIFARAMRQVVLHEPTARLVFLGQGSSWPALAQAASELRPGAIEVRPLVPARVAARWHRAAAAALVSVRPGLGYDFAYPTKVLAALACGTPVVYAGPGPAARDLLEHGLGDAVAYDVDAVARAMLRALRAEPDDAARRRRAGWVLANRSLAATGAAAAAVVLSLDPHRGRL